MSTIYPGLQFYAEVIPVATDNTLRRTPSTYSYGNSLELAPNRNDLYVICADGSVESVWDPARPIGWELFEDANKWFYRISQVGFEPQDCLVRFHSRAVEIRPGGRGVGTRVLVARNLERAFSRHAAIYEAEEEGEPEVTSTPLRTRPESRAEWESLEPFELEWQGNKDC